jgi:glycosyltransferase involved in cell wall biosynthesis
MVGTICERKNQLALMHSAIQLNHPIVFVGRIDLNNSDYTKAFVKLLNENAHLFQHFEALPSDELLALYQSSSVIACISHQETEPASILEGMLFNKPIIAANRPFAKNRKFAGIILVEPTEVNSITRGLENALRKKVVYYSNFKSINHYSRDIVDLYVNLYKKL